MFARSLDYDSFKTEFPVALSDITEEILSHDFETFSKLLNFLNGSLSTYILHGFMGSGKSAMINLLPECINSDVLYFRVNCFESTNLDDVLLSLHTDFVNYHNEKKIILPKVESNGFTDRINAYIKSGNKPMLFVFDSIDSEKYPLQKEIVNFIKHISQIDKIKVIIASRNLASDDLPNDSSSNFAVIKLCGKEEVIALLKKYGLEADDETYENIFVASKGHYLYISLIINVVKLLNISLKSLYNDYAKKKMTIFDYLISKVLTLIPEKFFKLLWFLTLIRCGVREQFLINEKFTTHDQLEYLKERMLLCREGSNIYLKDYVKQTVENTINAQTRKDINQYLYELYESQLPKKPSERDLIISRSTMRRESAYHKEEADKVVVESTQTSQGSKTNFDYNYLSYSNSIKKDWNFANSSIAPKQQQRFIKPAPRGLETRIQSNLRSRQYELSNEELSLLNQLNMKVPTGEFVRPDRNYAPQNNLRANNMPNNTNSDYNFIKDNNMTSEQFYQQTLRRNTPQDNSPQEAEQSFQPQEKVETLATVMQEARAAQDEFNYEKALAIYGKAYSMTEEAGYNEVKPIIMLQTAYCHKKMQNNDEALKCFDSAYNLYGASNPAKANEALFNMAEIYSEIYSYMQAKNIYEKILSSGENLEETFKIKVLLNLADLENNNSAFDRASHYYSTAINLATQSDNKPLICEGCFKYALACDDIGETEKAFKLYLRCVNTSNDVGINSYLSSAYSNIAEIYEDQNAPDKAIRYYEEAAKADEQQQNWDGLYFECTKITAFYQKKSHAVAMSFAQKALDAAKNLENSMYIASSYVQLGDCQYQNKLIKEALSSYLNAKLSFSGETNSSFTDKVDVRIENVKKLLPEQVVSQIYAELGIFNG